MTFEKLAKQYLASPQYKGLAIQSQRMYGLYVKRLIVMGGKLPVRDADLDSDMQKAVARSRSRVVLKANDVEPNLCGLWFLEIHTSKEGGRLITNSMKLALRTTLSVIYKWAVFKGHLTSTENFVPSIPKRPWAHETADAHPFTVAEMERIEERLKNKDVPDNVRCYGYFGLMAFYTGLRPDEMFDHESTWFTVRDGTMFYEVHSAKGRAVGELSRYCAFGAKELEIMEWFKDQPKAMGFAKYTFRTDKGHKFTQSIVCERFKEVCRLSGVEPRAFYNTRRGLAKAMHNNGYKLPQIAARLGNTERVASRYTSLSKMEKAEYGLPMKLRA